MMHRIFPLLMLIAAASGDTVKRSADDENYALLIDAGSTGSRLKVYEWIPTTDKNVLPNVTLVYSQEFKPPLSSFTDNLPGLRNYMKDIVEEATKHVPGDKQSSTEIYLMATAGFRYLPAKKSAAIMDTVRSLLRDPTFSPFRYTHDDIQVIAGEEQAAYAWIALNYLKGFLSGGNESFGVLELGEDSTQIAFLPRGPMYSEEFQVVLAGHLYSLYVQSYLDFGFEGIQREIIHRRLKKNPHQVPLKNPCMLKKDVQSIPMNNGSLIKTKGQGKPATCLKILHKILRPRRGNKCWPKPCALGFVYQPRVRDRRFYATKAFVYGPEIVGGIRPDDTLDLNDLKKKAVNDYCLKSLSTIQADGGDKKNASSICISSLYMAILFNKSYGFPMNTHQITLSSEVNGEDIDWTLGAMILEISRSQCEDPYANIVVGRRKKGHENKKPDWKDLIKLIARYKKSQIVKEARTKKHGFMKLIKLIASYKKSSMIVKEVRTKAASAHSVGTKIHRILELIKNAAAASGDKAKTIIAKDEKYALLIDAGSTGSRLKVYKWIPTTDKKVLPDVNLIFDQDFKPTLSSFTDNLPGLRNYMKDIVTEAEKHVPEEKQSSTKIVLLATAEFRFLPAKESGAIMTAVRVLLRDPTFSPFRYTHDDIQVISGEEEAAYAWIALNYLKGFLSGGNESFGVLELGGGSTQIAFLPKGPMYSEEFQIVLAGHLYSLYVQSYLNFGLEGIQREITHRLLKKNPNQVPLKNPCMLKGDVQSIPMNNGSSVENKGQGDPATCLKILHKIVKPRKGYKCWPKPCALGSVYQPRVGDRRFYAVDAFVYGPEIVGGIRPDGTIDLNDLEEKAVNDYCLKSFSTIQAEGVDTEYASSNCISSLYMAVLFNQSYGFPMDTHQITLSSEVNGEDIDWTMGAMILEISRSQCSDPYANMVVGRRKK